MYGRGGIGKVVTPTLSFCRLMVHGSTILSKVNGFEFFIQPLKLEIKLCEEKPFLKQSFIYFF